jgi:hypothetical protein
MTHTPAGFNPNVAHISCPKDGDVFVFQVLNAEGTDWDEAATRASYEEWLAENP